MRRAFKVFALILGLALLASCGQAARTSSPRAAQPTATHSPIATPTLAPAVALAWQARPSPFPIPPNPDAVNAGPTPGFALTQADANTAYACAPAPNGNAVHVWLTRDGGALWSPATDIATTSPATRCTLVADDIDPAIVVAEIYGPLPADCTPCYPGPAFSVATVDSGKTWAPENGPFDTVFEMATRNGITYALFRPHPVDLGSLQGALVMSSDHLRTWNPITAPPIPASPPGLPPGAVERFWLNPYNGAMLALTTTPMMDTAAFATSPGPNQPWTSASTPPYGFQDYDTAVQQPYTAAPWVFCGADDSFWYINGQYNTHTRDIECSTDGGATWRIFHLDETDYGPTQPEYTLLAVADDGAILLQSQATVARVVLPAARIESLGNYPNAGALAYIASGGAGMLWCGPFFNYTDPRGGLYAAPYA